MLLHVTRQMETDSKELKMVWQTNVLQPLSADSAFDSLE